MNKNLMKKLDQIIQERASKKRCYYCGTTKNVVGHHIIRRANLLYRWDEKNILPVCMCCHRKIHDGFLKEPEIINNTNNIKDFLQDNILTIDEFMINKYQELSGKKITINTKNKNLIHKPKIKREKTEYEKNILKKQKELRKQKYLYLKNLEKVNKGKK